MTASIAATATCYQFQPAEVFQGRPFDHDDLYDPIAVTVEWRGGDRWAVLRGHGWSPQLVWSEKHQAWEYEPSPSSLDAEFEKRCRYSLEVALAIGQRLAEHPELVRRVKPRVS